GRRDGRQLLRGAAVRAPDGGPRDLRGAHVPRIPGRDLLARRPPPRAALWLVGRGGLDARGRPAAVRQRRRDAGLVRPDGRRLVRAVPRLPARARVLSALGALS